MSRQAAPQAPTTATYGAARIPHFAARPGALAGREISVAPLMRATGLPQCRLQGLELFQSPRELVAVPIVLGVGDVLLRVLDLSCKHVAIEILDGHRHVG